VRPLHHPRRRCTDLDDLDDQGFTLVELLVVMVIIGVLAAIAVPVFLGQRQKAQETAVRSDLRNIAAQVHAKGLADGKYPSAQQLNDAGVVLKTSATVRATVVWTSATDFCLAGTSSGAGPDPTGLAQQVGVSTRIIVVSASRGATPVTTADRGCLAGLPASLPPGAELTVDKGHWTSAGFRNGMIS